MCEEDSIKVSKLVDDNAKLVELFVNKMNYGYVERDDLYQAGLMGLFHAAKHYDESKETKFSTFASYYIISEIKRELRENKLVKYSKKICRVKRKINNITDLNELNKIIKEEGISKEEVFNLYVAEDKGIVTLNDDLIENTKDKNKSIFKYAEECLSGIFLEIIEMKYKKNLSQEVIGEKLNLSQSKISRIEKVCLEKLKEYYLNYNNIS